MEAAVLALRHVMHDVANSSDRMKDIKVCAHFATEAGPRDFPRWLLGETANTPGLRTDCLQHRAATWLFPTISCGVDVTGFATYSTPLPVACWIHPPNPNGLEGLVVGFAVSRSPTLEFEVVRTYQAIG